MGSVLFSMPWKTVRFVCVLSFSMSAVLVPLVDAGAAKSDVQEISGLSLAELLALEVVTPSKALEALEKSPNSVSVYTSREIEMFGGRDLGEVLSRIPSLQAHTLTPLGRNNLTMRGDQPLIDNNHILMLLNGTPLNRESYTGGIWNQSMVNSIPLKIIDRIEVVRGPGSVLYGTNAYAGVINIITKRVKENSGDAVVGYGTNETVSADLQLGFTKDELEINTAMSFLQSDGWTTNMNDLSGNSYSQDLGEKNAGVMGTVNYRNWYGAFFWGKSDQDAVRGSALSLAPGYVDNEKYFLSLEYKHDLGPDWEVRGKASHVGGRTDLLTPFSQADIENGTAPLIHYKTNDSLGELTFDGSPTDRTRLLLGGTINYLTGSVPPPFSTVPDWDDLWWSLYGEFNYQFDRVKIVAGAQYNKTEEVDGNIVPRLGLVADLSERFTLKALYGQAFRSPYNVEKKFDVPNLPFLKGNEDLDPENVQTIDLSLLYNDGSLQSAITFFVTKQNDLIVRVPDPDDSSVITFQNAESLEFWGLELEAKKVFRERWFFTGSYLYQENESSDGIEDFSLQPNHILKLGAGYAGDVLSAGLFNTYNSEYPESSIRVPGSQPVNPEADSYNDLSFKASANLNRLFNAGFKPVLSLEFYASNLLGEDFFVPVPPGAPQSGINTFESKSGRQFTGYLRARF